jgi:hypothetical protein
MRAWGVLVLAVVAACTAKVESDLSLDGKVFQVDECRSGQRLGFVGIQLSDAAGLRIRLVARADGEANAFLFGPGAETGQPLGACGPFVVEDQNSKINSVRNVAGHATLACTAEPHVLKGTVTFKNCH